MDVFDFLRDGSLMEDLLVDGPLVEPLLDSPTTFSFPIGKDKSLLL